jgi:hypothetical protein
LLTSDCRHTPSRTRAYDDIIIFCFHLISLKCLNIEELLTTNP